MSAPSVENMIRLVGHILPSDGVFCLYGPFNVDGEFTSESNARFHESLQQQDPAMGIRDLEMLESTAASAGTASRPPSAIARAGPPSTRCPEPRATVRTSASASA